MVRVRQGPIAALMKAMMDFELSLANFALQQRVRPTSKRCLRKASMVLFIEWRAANWTLCGYAVTTATSCDAAWRFSTSARSRSRK